ncbi:hypothetical protein KAS08_00840 [Candidatus Pacearchaeota archaeon]|nr:hypothetical protein [Candidatus Pacearchaeota archaeon]
MSLENKIGNFVKGAKDVAMYVVKHPVKTVATVGLVTALAGCNLNTPDPATSDNNIYIALNGAVPYEKVIGNPYIESGATATNEAGESVPYDITQYNFDTDDDGYEELGEGVTMYSATNSEGKVFSKGRNVQNVIESQRLEDIANALSITPDGQGGMKTAMEVANDEEFYLERGENDNVNDDIEGEYSVVGSLLDSNGIPHNYSFDGFISNQDGFSVDVKNYPNSVLTGYVEGKAGISSIKDRDGDGVDDISRFRNMDILSSGVLSVDAISVCLTENPWDIKWIKYTETWTPK